MQLNSRFPLYVTFSFLLCILTQPTSSYADTEDGAMTSALRNTLIVPLKQIHDALEPLQQIRDDLHSLVTTRPAGPLNTCNNANGVYHPRDCGELYKAGYQESGVYNVYIFSAGQPVPVSVYCDMDTDGGGWLVFQRRHDGSEDFYRNWKAYLTGFGNITKEFWIGNELLHILTANKMHEMRVDLRDHEGQTAYAKYQQFYVGPPTEKFAINISSYSGTAGDSMSGHNDSKFSTKDQDNDAKSGSSCALSYKGAWWYKSCHSSNLNGMYAETGAHNGTSHADHVTWVTWRGYRYSIQFTEMKIRPHDF